MSLKTELRPSRVRRDTRKTSPDALEAAQRLTKVLVSAFADNPVPKPELWATAGVSRASGSAIVCGQPNRIVLVRVAEVLVRDLGSRSFLTSVALRLAIRQELERALRAFEGGASRPIREELEDCRRRLRQLGVRVAETA